MEKIKVNLDSKTMTNLLSDMDTFFVVKKNGEVNKNKFLNLLFENYYEEYNLKLDAIYQKALTYFKEYGSVKDSYEFAERFSNELFFNNTNTKTTYFSNFLTLTLTNSNDLIFQEMLDKLKYQSASSYFRNMIYDYLMLPQYKRSEIIYKDIVIKANTAIKENCKIKLLLDNDSIQEMIPYKVSTTKEELYSFIIGIYKNKQVVSTNICKIKSIIVLKEKAILSSDSIALLDKNIDCGVNFPFNDSCNAIIKLNDFGKNTFKKRYIHRPKPIKIVDDLYYFSCSFYQLVSYFFAFGENALVIEPVELKNKLSYLYYKASLAYRKN